MKIRKAGQGAGGAPSKTPYLPRSSPAQHTTSQPVDLLGGDGRQKM